MSSHKSKSQESSVKSGQRSPASNKKPTPPPSAKPSQHRHHDKDHSHHHHGKKEKGPCPHLCTLVPTDVPAPELTHRILHPRKDVFVLKVAKVGPNGDRHCRMELELVTPKANTKIPAYRVDTRETQCDPECTCCSKCCGKRQK